MYQWPEIASVVLVTMDFRFRWKNLYESCRRLHYWYQVFWQVLRTCLIVSLHFSAIVVSFLIQTFGVSVQHICLTKKFRALEASSLSPPFITSYNCAPTILTIAPNSQTLCNICNETCNLQLIDFVSNV